MTVDKMQVATDLWCAHKEALVQAEQDLNRYASQVGGGQGGELYKRQIAVLNNLLKLVKTYEALKQTPPGKLLSVQAGSVVIVRMGIDNEKRSYFIHDGFCADPLQWSLKYPSSSSVRLGDMKTFGGLKVGDTYVSYEGRVGDQAKSTNHVIEIL
jgi:hypothetical protein